MILKLVITSLGFRFDVKSISGLSGKGLCELKDSRASEIGQHLCRISTRPTSNESKAGH